MSIRLKILLVTLFFVVAITAQGAFFYIQQERFTGLLTYELSQTYPLFERAQPLKDTGSQEISSTKKSFEDISKQMSGLATTGTVGMLLFLVCAILGGAASAFFLIKSILPPLKRAVTITNDISVGYLENTIDPTGSSETDALLKALGGMQESLRLINENLERQVGETEVAYYNMEQSSATLNVANASLASLNASMNTILDALEQGLFLFGEDGICSDVSSKACLTLLEASPAGISVAELLKLSPEEGESITRLLKLIFSDSDLAADPGDLMALFPENFIKSDETKITLTYHAILDSEKKIRLILGVATDHTAEEEALKQLHDRETEALSVLRISGNRNLFTQFYRSITGFFSNTEDMVSLDMVRRDLHTFKGNASIFHLQDIVDLLHVMENRLVSVSTAEEAQLEIKAEIPKLQAVLTKTHKQAYDLLGRDFDQHGITRTLPLSALAAMSDRIKIQIANDNLYHDFVETLMGEPIRQSLSTFDIGLHELADRYGKEIAPCYFTGENFLLLAENYQSVFATLTHISRNIISHAIDSPELREERSKDPQLTVIIETKKYKVGNQEWFQLSFEDDGCGLNVPLLREKIANGSSEEEAAKLTDKEVMNCIFRDNLSTQEEANELAGRGVGLSALKYEAEKLGGKVDVESEWGVFTKIIIDMPINWSWSGIQSSRTH